jgi:transposase InsO family protein
LALVVLSVVEQRLDAVRAVLAGADVTQVAADVGVHRSTLHRWVGRYLTGQLAGLADRSHRPVSCPHQSPPDVEVAVAEMRRAHPRWGSRRIRLEMLRRPVPGLVMPAERTIDRILIRQGLLRTRPRKKPKSAYQRFERPGPMQLWGIDIVGGIDLVDTRTGQLRGAKLVTGVDDHSRFCVIAAVVEHATGRAVCLALAQALGRFGVPEQIITDNGKQFTDRFGKGGEVLFDKICRHNGITHLLTAPSSPNQNGKVERFHGTFRPEFLTDTGPFDSVQAAQAAVDEWVEQYNTNRPHQGLDPKVPVTPADRFAPVPANQRDLVPLWLPPILAPLPATKSSREDDAPDGPADSASTHRGVVEPGGSAGYAVVLDKVVPPSGNMTLLGKQLWLGPARAGQVVHVWAGVDLIHLTIGGARVKTVRSHLSVADLATLTAEGAVSAQGESPLPPPEDGDALEVERCVSRLGLVSLGNRQLLAAEILGGRRVGIRIEPATLMFFDLDSRELLRTRPNPVTMEQAGRLRGARPAGPPPRPRREPITVQRRASNTGVVVVCGQKVALGRAHQHQTVKIHVAETSLAIELDDQETRIVRRITTLPVRNVKADRPRAANAE